MELSQRTKEIYGKWHHDHTQYVSTALHEVGISIKFLEYRPELSKWLFCHHRFVIFDLSWIWGIIIVLYVFLMKPISIHAIGTHSIQLLYEWLIPRETVRIIFLFHLFVMPSNNTFIYLKNIMRSSMEARSPSEFYHIDVDVLHKCISTQEIKQSFKFQSDSSSDCFTTGVWKIKWWIHHFIFLLSYCYLYLITQASKDTKFNNSPTRSLLGEMPVAARHQKGPEITDKIISIGLPTNKLSNIEMLLLHWKPSKTLTLWNHNTHVQKAYTNNTITKSHR